MISVLACLTALALTAEIDVDENKLALGRRRSACEPEPLAKWIEDMDFYHTFPILTGAGKNWYYFSAGDFIANGGVLTTGCFGGYLDSSVYTVTSPQSIIPEFDHLKYLIFSEKEARVPKRGELVIEWKASGRTFNTDQNPFGPNLTEDNDPRLASSGFLASDPDYGLAFSFLLTNDRVYIMYQRQPYMRFYLGRNYAAFTYIIPVKMRDCADVHRLRLTLDERRKEVRYYVDYRLVLRVTKVGYRLPGNQYITGDYGGVEEAVFPSRMEYGFGSFTMLDQYPVCQKSDRCSNCSYPSAMSALVNLGNGIALPQYNPFLGEPSPASYYDPLGKAVSRLWGQGSESRIYKLNVYEVHPMGKADIRDFTTEEA